jgi:hypothetical protein
MKNSNVNFKQTLRQDDVFVPSEVKSLTEMTGLSTISSKSHAIICGDQIVNVVSEKYCHMPNEQFFLSVEEKLINADIKYIQRSINNDNRTFAIDYILDDESYFVNVKTKNANGIVNAKPTDNKFNCGLVLPKKACVILNIKYTNKIGIDKINPN